MQVNFSSEIVARSGMNTQEVIWLDSRSICDPEQIRYVDLAFILCGSSVKTIYSN